MSTRRRRHSHHRAARRVARRDQNTVVFWVVLGILGLAALLGLRAIQDGGSNAQERDVASASGAPERWATRERASRRPGLRVTDPAAVSEVRPDGKPPAGVWSPSAASGASPAGRVRAELRADDDVAAPAEDAPATLPTAADDMRSASTSTFDVDLAAGTDRTHAAAHGGTSLPAGEEPQARREAVPRVERTRPAERSAPSPGKSHDDGEVRWELPPPGYARDLEAMDPKATYVNDLRVSVTVAPDAYRYFMARGFEELDKAGYGPRRLEIEVRKLHNDHRGDRRKTLFRVSLTAGEGSPYFFFQKEPQKHFALRAGGVMRSFARARTEDRPEWDTWSVFEYPPNEPRRYKPRVRLGSFKQFTVDLTTSARKPDDREPFSLIIGDVLRTEKTSDPRESIDWGVRQISCTRWSDLVVRPVAFTFYPGRWELPKAPPGFDELLERL